MSWFRPLDVEVLGKIARDNASVTFVSLYQLPATQPSGDRRETGERHRAEKRRLPHPPHRRCRDTAMGSQPVTACDTRATLSGGNRETTFEDASKPTTSRRRLPGTGSTRSSSPRAAHESGVARFFGSRPIRTIGTQFGERDFPFDPTPSLRLEGIICYCGVLR